MDKRRDKNDKESINLEELIKGSSFMVNHKKVDIYKIKDNYDNYLKSSSPDRDIAFNKFDIGDNIILMGILTKIGNIVGDNGFNSIRFDKINIINSKERDNVIDHMWFRSFNLNHNNINFFANLDSYKGNLLEIEGILSEYDDGVRGIKPTLTDCNIFYR